MLLLRAKSTCNQDGKEATARMVKKNSSLHLDIDRRWLFLGVRVGLRAGSR